MSYASITFFLRNFYFIISNRLGQGFDKKQFLIERE